MTFLVVSDDRISMENEAIKYSRTYNPSDVFWIKKTADKKEITVDVISEMINQVNLSAVSGKKLFIIFEAESMNVAAQNKLLKTIESEDDSTTFMFLCKNLTNILPTIRSRSIIRYHQPKENLTIKQLAAENPNSSQIYSAAEHLLKAHNLDEALPHIQILAKPEHNILTLDALNRALNTANFPAEKKLRLYNAIANFSRNIAANCNPINAFDMLILNLF